MINTLRVVLILILFIFSRVAISKIIGKRARKVILEEIEIKHKIKSSRIKVKIRNIALFITIFLLSIVSGHNIIFAIILAILSVALIYLLDTIRKKINKRQVLQDLLNISECFRVQISSQIPLGNVLRSLPELCENKEFSILLTNVYLEYELSKFVILDSKEMLINRFNYPEMQIFISALNQQIQGTSGLEAFDNLITALKEKYIEFLEDSTKSKMAIMTLGVFIIVINIAAIGIYPVAVEAFNAMNVMLK